MLVAHKVQQDLEVNAVSKDFKVLKVKKATKVIPVSAVKPELKVQ
ncbi:hypothetical protein SPNIH34_17050 [Streptococcus pyogenes]|nr:hypothetical protein SPNIH34_17050 [Streptococcus pyogenes]